MAYQISGSVAVDETSGTQNTQTSSNAFADNDVTIATLSANAAGFDLLLAQVAGLGVTPTGASVSNADTSNPTGTPLITGLTNVTDLAFTDSLGQPLDGDLAMFGAGATDFLMTADGYKIYLYSYSVLAAAHPTWPADLNGVDENNAVFGIKANLDGTANVNGALVFAAYLQPTDASGNVLSSDSGAAGAKVWMAEYLPIQHGTAGSTATAYDDARLLFDPLYVGVSTRQDFSLEGAPSGQNLFLMYADGSPAAGETAIVVTGKHPANQSGADLNSTADDISITTGDSVNTGQGGGKTTIGTNNQMIDPNEGMYFTFVTLSSDSVPLTVPNLDQNEADVEANITFDSFLGANEAIFKVVQLQPPKQATMLLTALNNADGTEKGNLFIDGLGDGTTADSHGPADDTQVNISWVQITRDVKVGKTTTTYQLTYVEGDGSTSNPPGGPLSDIQVDFSGNTVKITGVRSGDQVDYKTDGLHNRVLIDNVGNTDANINASFDIGGFSLVNSSVVPNHFQSLSFQDDGPTAGIAVGTSEVIVDETSGNQDDDVTGATTFDKEGDGGAVALSTLFAITGAQTDTNLPQYAVSSGSVVTSTGTSGGTDGLKSTVFSLSIVGGDGTDSLLDTTDGKNIKLFKEGDLIVGRYDTANGTVDGTDPAAFAIAIDQTGKVAVAQYVSLKHTTPGDGTTPAGSWDERMDLTGLLNAVVTATDNDNDTATASTAIGDKINFDDDHPTAGIAVGTSEVIVDETVGNQDDDVTGATTFDKEGDGTTVALSALFAITGAQTDTNLPQYAVSGGAVVASTGTSGGTDGLKSTVFSLSITGGNGTDSLLDTTDGKNIKLFKEGDLIVGRYDAANGTVDGTDPAAFAIAIDQTGKVAVAQYVSLWHPTAGNGTTPAGSFDERIDLTGLINAVVTATDNDDDTDSTSTAIGDKINFDDDGPSLGFGNVIGTGTIDPQYGYWTMSPGTDGLWTDAGNVSLDRLNITLDTFQLVKPDSTVVNGTSFTFSETAPSPDGSGAYHWTGSLTGDLDNNPDTADNTEHFTLTAYTTGALAGTYAIDLVEGFQSTIVTSTAGGSLGAGGPDPAQTLTLVGGVEQVVFFAVNPTTADSNTDGIKSAILAGAPDYDEPTLQQKSSMADYDQISSNGNQAGDGTYSFINDTYAMNVSTSGIGVNNNVLQGNSTAGIQSDDESFVINPQTLLTAMQIFIDNSVGGYNTASEVLAYRAYYSDGTMSALTEVTAGMLTSEAGGQKSFTVQREGSKLIDAVQLVMEKGDIKIPVIQFISETNNLADGINLGFTATIKDGDGDTASSSFVANLAANAVAGSFDFVLTGTSGADAFNVDLPSAKNVYQVNSFTVGTDKLVLLGANSYTIDNTGDDSVVDITETVGGQHTIVTVVGVNMVAGDIATIV